MLKEIKILVRAIEILQTSYDKCINNIAENKETFYSEKALDACWNRIVYLTNELKINVKNYLEEDYKNVEILNKINGEFSLDIKDILNGIGIDWRYYEFTKRM